MGRKTEYTQEKAEEICELIASSPRNTAQVISEMEGMPCVTTIFKWLRENDEFAQSYTRAKEAQADILVDEMLTIADDGSLDVEMRTSRDGSEYEATNMDVIQRSKLMIETRKWLAGKLRPKKYGDKLQVDNTSSDGSMTPTIIERVIIDKADD